MCNCRFFLIALLLAPLQASSVAGADEEAASVSGKITLDGKPLSEGRILFHQPDSDQIIGTKIKAGNYRIRRIPPGQWKVTIEFPGSPLRYSDEKRTSLVCNVNKGANELDFALKGK